MQISTNPFVTTGAYAKIGTMELKNDISTTNPKEPSVEQSQFDHAQLEEVMDHHQHLTQMHEDDQHQDERMIVQSGNGTRNKLGTTESRFKEEPSKFTTNEVVNNELITVQLKGITVDMKNAEMLTQLLRGRDSWLHLFGAIPSSEVQAYAMDINAGTLVPARQPLIKYAETILQALGMRIDPVLEKHTSNYTIVNMVQAAKQLQEVVNAILEDWNEIVQMRSTSAKNNRRSHYQSESINRPTMANISRTDPKEPRKNPVDYEEIKQQPRTYVPVEAIPPFSRGSAAEAEAWLKKFLYVANQAGWDNKMRCETFEFKMEGHASYWHTALSSDVQKVWSKLVHAFKNNYSVGLQSPQEKYWSASREDKESALDYLVRLNALGKRAGIDYHGYSSAEHVRRYLSTVRDHKVSDRFLALGIVDIKTLEQRLRDLELGQKRLQSATSKPVDHNLRRSQAYRAAPVRSVHWYDDEVPQDPYYDRYYEEREYYDYEENRPRVYAAEDRSRHPSMTGSSQRRREDDHYGHRSRYFQDWSNIECKDCGRMGHPTERCLFRCKACRVVHQEGECPLRELARRLKEVPDGEAIPEDVRQILGDLNC